MTLTVLEGDCRVVLAGRPAASIHCCITSPPFWGLRQYAGVVPAVWGGQPACPHDWTDWHYRLEYSGGNGRDGSILQGSTHHQEQTRLGPQASQCCHRCGAWQGCLGLEPTPALYVAHVVECMEAVGRVLRDDGTLWMEIGDTFLRAPHHGSNGLWGLHRAFMHDPLPVHSRPLAGKPKDLALIPFRLAIALQEAGWYVRQVIIWHHVNGLPESVRDRPTTAHSYVLLLTRSARYYYDAEAIKEPASWDTHARKARAKPEHGPMPSAERNGIRPPGVNPKALDAAPGIRANASFAAAVTDVVHWRNARSVWPIPSEPFSSRALGDPSLPEHYAAFPSALAERCLRAGTSAYGCCAACGAPYLRVVERETGTPVTSNGSSFQHGKSRDAREPLAPVGTPERTTQVHQRGFQPSCRCGVAQVRPCLVLDPFAGSGTTGMAAVRLQRDALLIDASPAYVRLARARCAAEQPLFVAPSREGETP